MIIQTPISISATELCRDAVAVILKDNFDYQYISNYNPYADLKQVYIETTNPDDQTLLSFITVSLDNVTYSNKSYNGSVIGNCTINVDIFTKSKTAQGVKGDSASRLKCTRMLSIGRYVLEDPIYKTLGFAPGFINGVSVESIGMADPEKYDTNNVSMGRLVFNVILTENNLLLNGFLIDDNITKHRIGETEEGFKYVLEK